MKGKYSFELNLATVENQLENVLDVSFIVRESERVKK
jgi:hypothetical protein